MKLTYNSTTGGADITPASSPSLMGKESVTLEGLDIPASTLSIMTFTPGMQLIGSGELVKGDGGTYTGTLNTQTTECMFWMREIGQSCPRPKVIISVVTAEGSQAIYQPVNATWNMTNRNAATTPVALPTYLTKEDFADMPDLADGATVNQANDYNQELARRLKGEQPQ